MESLKPCINYELESTSSDDSLSEQGTLIRDETQENETTGPKDLRLGSDQKSDQIIQEAFNARPDHQLLELKGNLDETYLESAGKRIRRAKLAIKMVKDHREEGVIGGRFSHVAIKNHNIL